MRNLIITQFMSLDGVIEEPAWSFKYWNDEIAAFKGEETSANQDMLLGRVTYEGFASAWPTSPDEGAAYFNNARKFVVSTTLDSADWNNSHIIRENVVETVKKLREQDGADIVVHGSAKLAQTLMQHDLIDSYRLLVYPLVLGQGKRLFQEETPTNLNLIESRSFSSGVVSLVYRTERAADTNDEAN